MASAVPTTNAAATPEDNARALYDAVRWYRAEEVLDILARGVDVNTPSGANEETPLMVAVQYGSLKMVQLLLDNNADITCKNKHDYTAFSQAVTKGSIEITTLLLDEGALVNASHRWGVTPLMAAARAGNARMITLLLARGADVTAQDDHGSSALSDAAAYGYTDCMELLMNAKAPLDLADSEGMTPLMWAVEGEELESQEEEADGREDENAAYEARELREGKEEAAKMLVKAGAALDLANEKGEGAADIARRFHMPEIAHLIETTIAAVAAEKARLAQEQLTSRHARVKELAHKSKLRIRP